MSDEITNSWNHRITQVARVHKDHLSPAPGLPFDSASLMFLWRLHLQVAESQRVANASCSLDPGRSLKKGMWDIQ